MSAPNDGGPAFPRTGADGHTSPQSGMSLRDYFAAHAGDALIIAMLNSYGWGIEPNCVAVVRYQIADSMLAERNREAQP